MSSAEEDSDHLWHAPRHILTTATDTRLLLVGPGDEKNLINEVRAPGDRQAVARIYRFEFAPGDIAMLWGGQERYWLDLSTPVDHSEVQMIRLLRTALAVVSENHRTPGECSVHIRWPTGHAAGAAALGQLGFRKQLHLAALREPPNEQNTDNLCRTATPADASHVAALMTALHKLESDLGAFRFPAFAADHITSHAVRRVSEGGVLVTSPPGDGISGCLEYVEASDDGWVLGAFDVESVAMICNVYVLPKHRGKGLARQLLTRAIRLTAGASLLCMQYTEANRPAQRFWRQAGFVPYWTTWTAQPI